MAEFRLLFGPTWQMQPGAGASQIRKKGTGSPPQSAHGFTPMM